jgi:hypothetical protein
MAPFTIMTAGPWPVLSNAIFVPSFDITCDILYSFAIRLTPLFVNFYSDFGRTFATNVIYNHMPESEGSPEIPLTPQERNSQLRQLIDMLPSD